MEISIKGEELTTLGGFPITNSFVTTLIVVSMLAIMTMLYHRDKVIGKSTTLTIIIDTILIGLYDFVKGILGKDTNKLFPLLVTSLFFIVACNWSGLLPGVGSILFDKHPSPPTAETIVHEPAEDVSKLPLAENETETHNKVHLFRAPTADLNTTFALALIAVIVANYWGFKEAGIKEHLSKFFNVSSPINFFVGILELISELSRILSYAFRLFGNVFAGEVMITVMAFLMPVLIPFPFFGFEIFVGIIQALIFVALFTVFTSLAMQKPHHT